MMNVGLRETNLYDSCEKDCYYFKVGRLGVASFHGRNYHIRRRITADQLNSYLTSGQFVKVSSGCYINISKVASLTDGMLHFVQDGTGSKGIHIAKWKQQHIKNLLSERNSVAM